MKRITKAEYFADPAAALATPGGAEIVDDDGTVRMYVTNFQHDDVECCDSAKQITALRKQLDELTATLELRTQTMKDINAALVETQTRAERMEAERDMVLRECSRLKITNRALAHELDEYDEDL